MAAGTWTVVDSFRDRVIDAYIDGGSARTFKVALFLSTSNISTSSTTYAGLTNEHANGNGYTTGGVSVTLNRSGTTSLPIVFATNPSWAASGGDIVARYAVLYEVGGNVVAYVLLDSAPANVTISDGNTLTIDSDGTPSAVITVA